MRTLLNKRLKSLRETLEWIVMLSVLPTLFIVCNSIHKPAPLKIKVQYITESVEDYSLSTEEEADMYLHMTINLIKKSEGFKSHWYKCPSGVRTIGYGFTHIKWIGEMTKKEADSILEGIYLETRSEVIKLVKNKMPEESHIAAMTSLTYNVGLGSLKESKLLSYMNSGKLLKARAEFRKWIYTKNDGVKKSVRGLINRRNKEIRLWDQELS